MPTHTELAKIYQDSVNAWLAVKTHFRATPEERAAATAAIDELNKAWIEDAQVSYHARTASLNVLVEWLNKVSSGINSDPLKPLGEDLELS